MVRISGALAVIISGQSIPDRDEALHEKRRDDRLADGHQDRKNIPQIAAAVDHGSIAQILRNGKEFLPEHEHLAGADKAGDAHAEIGVEQPQPGHGHIVGDEERVAGHHHCAENEEKAEVLPPELIVRQRKGRADGKHQMRELSI